MRAPLVTLVLALAGCSGATRPPAPGLLGLLDITPSAESRDYVERKQQFQLHGLLTEQRHPATMSLGEQMIRDPRAGLGALLSVDDDVERRLRAIRSDPGLRRLVAAFELAILERRKIYIYGCGATGRLAKQMESTFWRPFWRRLRQDAPLFARLAPHLSPEIEDRLIGEMTGADRALISSLEGFEDLQLIGRLQLLDRGVRRGDVVVAVTEGGETSSVIGTVLAALELWRQGGPRDGSRDRLFFVYNNPDHLLRPFERSRRVLDEPGITKLNLATGPQAIAGSTRMQATTIETFVVGAALQEAVRRVLARFLSAGELARAGFPEAVTLEERLLGFAAIQRALRRELDGLASLAALEAETYAGRRFSTYLAAQGLLTVFIDATERSPTFRLLPLDTAGSPRRCWIQVRTAAPDPGAAWRVLLGRDFRGLAARQYRSPFEREIEDAYLRRAALESLRRAGDDQQHLYDLSASERNLATRAAAGDLLVLILMAPGDPPEGGRLEELATAIERRGARVARILVGDGPATDRLAERLRARDGLLVRLRLSTRNDPFGLAQQVGLKMLLNAHSTAVMARLGRVIGNTMTSVSPSNLKLVGRATYLVQTHVEEALRRSGRRASISYAEANAVLFEARSFLAGRSQAPDQPAEVALSIVRVLESLRRGHAVSQHDALALLEERGLRAYLASY